MKTLLKGGSVFKDNEIVKADVLIDGGVIAAVGPCIDGIEKVIACDNFFVIPGLIDVHVHFREPGAEYKETIKTGSAAAAAGGYTTACAMPNLNPAPYNLKNLKVELDAIARDAIVNVLPYGRITDGKTISDLEELSPYIFAFSDDGSGVDDQEVMKQAMTRAKALGKTIVAHAEDTRWPTEDPRSEYVQVKRDIELAAETGCPYHICHVSTKESAEAVREAKKAGIDVSAETAPHYLVFCDEDIEDDGRFKMNPPIRKAEDREALLEGICDGTIDMIATDHAPHSREEKSKGFRGSLNGIVGLETAFPVMYTKLVEGGLITFERLIELMSVSPAKRFGLPGGKLEEGSPADIAVMDATCRFKIDPSTFKSKARSTPFQDMDVCGRTVMTICGGDIVYEG